MSAEKTKRAKKMKTKTAKMEAWRTRPMGYPRLAERMAVKPGTLVFRQFVALNARMLLYMQAELVELEEDLRAREQIDLNHVDRKRRRYASDFSYLMQSYKDGDATQLELVRTIQRKLEVYNKAILQQYKLNQIPGPGRYDLDDIQALLYSDAMGPGVLTGEDSTIWGHPDDPKIHSLDLIALCPREEVDTFSQVICTNAIRLFEFGWARIKKADHHQGNGYYDSSVLKTTR